MRLGDKFSGMLATILAFAGIGAKADGAMPVSPPDLAPEARRFGPRSMFPTRRAYALPPGDWTTPNRGDDPGIVRQIIARAEAKRARKAARNLLTLPRVGAAS